MNHCTCDAHLLVSFDFSNEPTWIPDTFDITSEAPIPNSELASFVVNTYGQTAVDNGRASLWTDKLVISGVQERKLTLIRSDILIPEGTPNTSGSGVYNGVNSQLLGDGLIKTDLKAGKYLKADGIGLSNFFKVEGHPYQLLPYRYVNGFSVETSIYMEPEDFIAMPKWEDGVFFYMGTRAENKFSDALHPELELLVRDDPQITFPTQTGIEGNSVALRVGKDGALSFRYVDKDGVVQNATTKSGTITKGWSVVLLTFTPTEPLANGDYDLVDDTILSCAPARNGKLALYVNGLMVLSECDFKEFSFKPFAKVVDKTPSAPTYAHNTLPVAIAKQAGVTYTISWGSGAMGLKNALELNHKTGILESQERFMGLTIEKNFSGVFQGGIQYLKIWDDALNFLDARDNFNLKAKSYGLFPIQGGRIIHTN